MQVLLAIVFVHLLIDTVVECPILIPTFWLLMTCIQNRVHQVILTPVHHLVGAQPTGWLATIAGVVIWLAAAKLMALLDRPLVRLWDHLLGDRLVARLERRRLPHLALAGTLLCGGAIAQPAPAPLFTCDLEREIALLTKDQPTKVTMWSSYYKGFVLDFSTGVFRWRGRNSDQLLDPIEWSVTQRGGQSNDWVAIRGSHGDRSVLRVRTWGEGGTRFALFDGQGTGFVGTCR